MTIEERAEKYGMESANLLCSDWSEEQRQKQVKIYAKVYAKIATEQKATDHSEEHLEWIIKQYQSWMGHNWHTPIESHCTFKEWIDKAMEE